MAYHTIGSKYDRQLDITDIAKLVRKELKEVYPNNKHSVRIERFAGGESITVETTVDFPVWQHDERGYRDGRTPMASEMQAKISAIVNAYNFDDSDSMTDYFHVNFYSSINLVESK